MPEWNSLTDAQRSDIIDAVMLPTDFERGQVAIEVYNAARKALNT
jgi:hypothetical protein